MRLITFLICFLSSFYLSAQPNISLEEYATGFDKPVDIAHAGDGRLFIVEQSGQIKIIDANGNKLVTPFFDISNKIAVGGERGLLGLTFHPNYLSNGFFFVNYIEQTTGNTFVERYQVHSNNPNIANPNSGLLILTIIQPYTNHNGGCLKFGGDGYLYIATGDGGSGGDPQNYSQNIQDLKGKMLRIDIDNTSNGNNYSIPADNPFAGSTSPLPEIWSIGLRNPWRFSFDSQTQDLWIGDVGQVQREEINFEPASSTGGLNYGWRCYEGFQPHNLSGCQSASNYTLPIYDYPRSEGTSVTGGFVYRGNSYPSLFGKYIYGDFSSGRIWSLSPNTNNGWVNEELLDSPYTISTFGVDNTNELYVASYNPGTIYKIKGSATCNDGVQNGEETGIDCGGSNCPACPSTCNTPTNLTLTQLSNTSISISWTAVNSATQYEVRYREGSSNWNSNTVTSTTMSLAGLSSGNTYDIRVRAFCASSVWSSFSPIQSIMMAGDCIPNLTIPDDPIVSGIYKASDWISSTGGVRSGQVTFQAANEIILYPGFEVDFSGGSNNNFLAIIEDCQANCRYNDSLALIELYTSTNGPNWTNTWNLSQPMSTWYGITTNSDGCVIVINLHLNGLSGTIPSELGNLINLTNLALPTNQLNGTIPSELGNLTNLTNLALRNNQLSGAIPSELGDLNNLEQFQLGNNQLSGSIPSSLGNLTNLEYFSLAYNSLTGSIPPELGNLNNLTLGLRLEYNQLSGCYASNLNPLCSNSYNFSNNSGLPGNGNFAAFCANGTGGCPPFTSGHSSSKLALENTNKQRKDLALSIAPNPTKGETLISYYLPTTGNIELAIYDLQGKMVKLLKKEMGEHMGAHQLKFSSHDLTNGLYHLRLTTGNDVLIKKLIILD